MAANKGHAKAQAIVAACYWDGMGVQQDVQRAVKWYCEAARQVDPISETSRLHLSASFV